MRSNRLRVAAAVAAVLVLAVAQTAGAVQLVKSQGSGSIQGTYGADLDLGQFNLGLPDGPLYDDVQFELATQTARYLTNFPGSTIVRMASKPTYLACKNAVMGNHSYRVGRNIGRWFCMHTNQDRFARVRIDSAPPGGQLAITWRTWCKANNHC